MIQTVKHGPEKPGLHGLILAPSGIADDAALYDHLRADFALGLQQNGVHVNARLYTSRPRLQRLRASNLAAISGNGGIVRHVLWLERPYAKAAIGECSRQPRNEKGLADIRAGALQHDCACSHQNSMPGWALTPAAK